MSVLELYLLTRCGAVYTTASLLIWISGILLVASGFIGIIVADCTLDKEEISFYRKLSRNMLLVATPLLAISILVQVLVPTNKDIAIIIAGNWATNSEEVGKLPENVVRTLNKFMEEYAPGREKK